jgi:6-phosphogluconate dehydrogenase
MLIGLIGLGKMGYNLALNLRNHGHQVVAFDLDKNAMDRMEKEGGVETVASLNLLSARLQAPASGPALYWMMIPAGEIIDTVLEQLKPLLRPSDIVVEGGNSHFKDSIRRSEAMQALGVRYLDCGTSGGTSGALNGVCCMVGGDAEAFKYVEPVLLDISVPDGCLYTGPAGSGHFVKMVHNGIEYGMMQAIAEGFEVLAENGRYDFDYQAVAKLWNHGSVIRGWLMELTEKAFSKDPALDSIRGVMRSSGEGKWTLETALDLGVPTPVIALSLMMRYRSLQDDTFSGKVVAALRNEFGGHAVDRK